MDSLYWIHDEVGGNEQEAEGEEDGGGEDVVQLTHKSVYVRLALEQPSEHLELWMLLSCALFYLWKD